jgi:PelA/Pel-15E family pectate lyase
MAYLTAYHATGEKFYLEAARDTARALVRGQYCGGGWDYIIEFDPEKRKQYPYRADNDCEASGAAGKAGAGKAGAASGRRRSSTLDDNVSQAALRLLMRVDHTLKFRDEKIHEAALFALESLMKVQYPNGAWPQKFAEPPDPERFPVRGASYPQSWERKWPGPDYRGHYTFNDNSLSDMIDAMLEASRIYDEARYQASAEKGGDFMLLAQMPEPQPGWAQQYDVEMHPAWARIFEPPSITGGESQGILKTLLLLYRETGKKKYLEPIPRALAYYRKLRLPTSGDVSAYRAKACPAGSICMARFYELKTDRPLYITKGTRVNVRGKSSSLLGGYELSYSDASVITHYGVITRGEGFEQAEAEYARVTAAGPATLKRPVRLSGLSPWSAAGGTEVSPSQQELAAAAAEAIRTLDKRGVWIEKGSVDRGDRVLQFFAAKDMVVTIGDRQHRLKENEYLRIYPGEKPPAENLIRSSTFARNVTALSEYLANRRR